MPSVPNLLKGFSWRLAIVAAILAAPLVLSSVWVWQQVSLIPSGYREGSSFQLIEGQGGSVPGGLQVTGLSAQGRAIVATELPDLTAKQYESIRFDIEGLDSAAGAGIYFTLKSQPTTGHPRGLTMQMARQGLVRISEDPRWNGEVQTIGFIIQGPLQRSILIRGITLVPATLHPVSPVIWIFLGLAYALLVYIGLAAFLGSSSGAKRGQTQQE